MPNENHEDAPVVVNPGPSQEVWDDALKNAGINPAEIAEYNVQDGADGADRT